MCQLKNADIDEILYVDTSELLNANTKKFDQAATGWSKRQFMEAV